MACSLSAVDLRQRQRDVASLAAGALASRSSIPGGERFVFRAAADTAARLERLVAAEAECCPFLTMDLRRDNDALVLDVTGSAEARPIVEELFA